MTSAPFAKVGTGNDYKAWREYNIKRPGPREEEHSSYPRPEQSQSFGARATDVIPKGVKIS
jgi:hypothetical protein